MIDRLCTVSEASQLITEGRMLLLAGEAALLEALPAGTWIGGTIPYFMTAEGGVASQDRLFVTELPPAVTELRIQRYDAASLPRIPGDYPDRGVSFIIVPGMSTVHQTFAQEGQTWAGVFDRPLAGWVAGVHLSRLGQTRPRVFDGSTRSATDDEAVVMHCQLRPGASARVDIVNPFKPGDGDALTFPADGFEVSDVMVGDRRMRFVDYLSSKGTDTRLPLIADYSGALVNVSIQKVDAAAGTVSLYAPVFEGLTYRFARPLEGDYAAAFAADPGKASAAFSCNCILNYVHGELEGRRTGPMVGPITFGEIAYILLNQTLVSVWIDG